MNAIEHATRDVLPDYELTEAVVVERKVDAAVREKMELAAFLAEQLEKRRVVLEKSFSGSIFLPESKEEEPSGKKSEIESMDLEEFVKLFKDVTDEDVDKKKVDLTRSWIDADPARSLSVEKLWAELPEKNESHGPGYSTSVPKVSTKKQGGIGWLTSLLGLS